MGTPNEDKSIRAQRIAKAWQTLHYSNGPVNCGNCAFADHDKWNKTQGQCNFIKGLPFPISALGICKQHSNFRDK
jgi:hypothetical protein